MTVLHLATAAKRAALLEHAARARQEAHATRDPDEKHGLLRDARDMMALALNLETEERAA